MASQLCRVMYFLLVFVSYLSCEKRVKRVINGVRVIGREGPYDVVRYTVDINNAHDRIVRWFQEQAPYYSPVRWTGVYGRTSCTGSLLTPGIVQTACHCVAVSTYTGRSYTLRVDSVFESRTAVFIGLNDKYLPYGNYNEGKTERNTKFALVEKMKYDEKCAPVTGFRRLRYNVYDAYDFGYVAIDKSWADGRDGVPTKNVAFAPLYTESELKLTHYRFVGHPPVCMVIGFGKVLFEDMRFYTESDYMEYGWARLMEDRECIRHTKNQLTDREFNAQRSWVCTEPFAQHFQAPYHGDSGGPLSCNNQYFGILSATDRRSWALGEHPRTSSTEKTRILAIEVPEYAFKEIEIELSGEVVSASVLSDFFQIYGTLIYTPYHNAYEHRRSLLLEYGDEGFSSGTIRDYVRLYWEELRARAEEEVEDQSVDKAVETLSNALQSGGAAGGELAAEETAVEFDPAPVRSLVKHGLRPKTLAKLENQVERTPSSAPVELPSDHFSLLSSLIVTFLF